MGVIHVETFEIQKESQGFGGDAVDEEHERAMALAADLGLAKQVEARKLEGAPARSAPYKPVDAKLSAIFQMLAPVSTAVRNYTGLLPLRILEAVKQAEGTGIFETVVVRHHTNMEIAEPAAAAECYLVGMTPGRSSPNYLLARWGVELAPFKDLVEEAQAEFTRQFKDKVAQVIDQVNMDAHRVKFFAERFVEGKPRESWHPLFPEYRKPE